MLYVMAFAVASVIIAYVGWFLHRQAAMRQAALRDARRKTHGRKTHYLREIRTKMRGGKHQDRVKRRRDV